MGKILSSWYGIPGILPYGIAIPAWRGNYENFRRKTVRKSMAVKNATVF